MKGQIIDINDDKFFSQIKEEFDKMPDFVKTAEVENKEKINDFALRIITEDGSILDKFPINNKSNTYLSDYYFQKTAEKLPPTAQKIAGYFIDMAKKNFGLEKVGQEATLLEEPASNVYCMVDAEKDYLNHFIKTSSVVSTKSLNNMRKDSDYALVKVANNNKKRFFGIWNKDLIKQACAYFDNNKNSLSIKDRGEYSKNVMNKIAELKLPVYSDNLLLYSGCAERKSEEQIKLALDARIKFSDEDSSEKYSELSKKASEMGSDTVCKMIYEIDKLSGISKRYDRFEDPYISVYEIKKEAVAIDEIDGKIITNEQVNSIELKKVASILSDELCSSFNENKIKTFKSLTKYEKLLLLS